jgi:hypothetical protein
MADQDNGRGAGHLRDRRCGALDLSRPVWNRVAIERSTEIGNDHGDAASREFAGHGRPGDRTDERTVDECERGPRDVRP